jgi:radical SAM superfamily enzyme YgiQ (UPF0313 family)
MIGKPVDLAKAVRIITVCRRLRIKSHATFTIGLPGETAEDRKETIRFAQNLDADSIQISIATPLPGTQFYTMARENGLLAGRGWCSFDGKVAGFAAEPELARLEKLRKKAMLVWLMKSLLKPARCYSRLYILFRTVYGMGVRNFLAKLISTMVDEVRNR